MASRAWKLDTCVSVVDSIHSTLLHVATSFERCCFSTYRLTCTLLSASNSTDWPPSTVTVRRLWLSYMYTVSPPKSLRRQPNTSQLITLHPRALSLGLGLLSPSPLFPPSYTQNPPNSNHFLTSAPLHPLITTCLVTGFTLTNSFFLPFPSSYVCATNPSASCTCCLRVATSPVILRIMVSRFVPEPLTCS